MKNPCNFDRLVGSRSSPCFCRTLILQPHFRLHICFEDMVLYQDNRLYMGRRHLYTVQSDADSTRISHEISASASHVVFGCPSSRCPTSYSVYLKSGCPSPRTSYCASGERFCKPPSVFSLYSSCCFRWFFHLSNKTSAAAKPIVTKAKARLSFAANLYPGAADSG
jgi:hypothetical protein